MTEHFLSKKLTKNAQPKENAKLVAVPMTHSSRTIYATAIIVYLSVAMLFCDNLLKTEKVGNYAEIRSVFAQYIDPYFWGINVVAMLSSLAIALFLKITRYNEGH